MNFILRGQFSSAVCCGRGHCWDNSHLTECACVFLEITSGKAYQKGAGGFFFFLLGNDLIHVACVLSLSNIFILVTSTFEHKPSSGVFSQPVTERQRGKIWGVLWNTALYFLGFEQLQKGGSVFFFFLSIL